MPYNPWLIAGGVANLIAAALHIACVFGGASWYRALGAGDRMVRMAERGILLPHIYAVLIGTVLTLWAAFAFSGAGAIGRLPFARTALAGISAIYLVRGILGPFLLSATGRSPAFLWWSSAIVLAIGLIHVIGTAQMWSRLSEAR